MLTVHYHTLGLSPDCTEADLRKRYLELVRRYPPESHPDKFSRIHDAYQFLKNPLESIHEMLFSFSSSEDSIDRIITDVIDIVHSERLPTPLLLQMGEQ